MPESLLRAIAQVETGMRSLPPSRNPDGTVDIGIMRINSRWLPLLERHGISRAALEDHCQNIHVGAWILATNRARHGDNWTAIGAYNVGCARLDTQECARRRNIYNWKAYCALVEGKDARCTKRRQQIANASP